MNALRFFFNFQLSFCYLQPVFSYLQLSANPLLLIKTIQLLSTFGQTFATFSFQLVFCLAFTLLCLSFSTSSEKVHEDSAFISLTQQLYFLTLNDLPLKNYHCLMLCSSYYCLFLTGSMSEPKQGVKIKKSIYRTCILFQEIISSHLDTIFVSIMRQRL